MYKLCKTEQSARRQRMLEEGLLSLMLQKSYEEISISELCDFLAIPRKSFYRYFSGKDGALYALIDHTLMDYESFTQPHHADQQRTLELDMQRFFLFWAEKKPLLDALARSGMSGVLLERSVQHALEEAGGLQRFLPAENREMSRHVVMFAVCGLVTMALNWHRSGYEESPERLAGIAARLISAPLFPNVDSYF